MLICVNMCNRRDRCNSIHLVDFVVLPHPVVSFSVRASVHPGYSQALMPHQPTARAQCAPPVRTPPPPPTVWWPLGPDLWPAAFTVTFIMNIQSRLIGIAKTVTQVLIALDKSQRQTKPSQMSNQRKGYSQLRSSQICG